MKKILSCIMALAILLGTVPLINAEETEAVSYSNAEQFAMGLGVVEEYERDEVITRAEFAGVLARLFGLINENADAEEWLENNYSEQPSETVLLDTTTRAFSDVDASHPYYKEIMAIYNRGYMRGVGDGLFAPEYNLAMKDAVSVFINILGYAQKYSENKNVPDNIGLLDGLDSSIYRPATQGDIVGLIYNSLDINVMEADWVDGHVGYKESDETFMTAVLNLSRVKGIMTDNGRTTFSGKSQISSDSVKVGDIEAIVSDNTEYVRDFIGHRVEMYYYSDDYENTVKYAKITTNDDAITFAIEDFESFGNNAISYNDGNREVTTRLDSSNLYMIYNGAAKTVFSEATFGFQSGDVTLISTNGSTYNLIVVNCYEFAVVNTRNLNDGTILNKIKVSAATDAKASELNTINCTEGEDYEIVVIKDSAGNILSFEELAENDVLNILRNDDAIYITVSRTQTEDFKIKSMGTDDQGRTYISNGDEEYAISDSYNLSDSKIGFILGNSCDIYLSIFNTVVWATKAQENESIGILTDVLYYDDGIELARLVTIYTSSGKLEELFATEKIRVNGEQKSFKNAWASLHDFYGKPIMYETNENGELVKIITPEGFGEFGDRGWHEIAPEGDYDYHANDNDLSRMMYYVSGKTTVFTVPTDAAEYEEEKNFSVNMKSFTDNDSVKASGYAKDKYSIIPDVIVVKTSAVVGSKAGTNNVLLIDNIYEGINSDDEPATVLSGYLIKDKAVSHAEFIVDPECVMVQRTGGTVDQNQSEATVGPRTVSELKPGDAIRYSTGAEGELISIRIAYDMSTGKAFSSGDGNDDNAQGTTAAGYAYIRSGEGVRITQGTSINPTSIDLKDASSVQNSLWAFRVNCPNAILVVEKKGTDGVRIYQGSLDDLKTYHDTNTVVNTDTLVLFTHWSSSMRGALIYKN